MAISVVIPAFNAARTLRQTLFSVLAQTRPPDEVIVADDGSTDGSADIAAAFGPPVRVLRQPHGGPSAATNAGVAAAGGDVLAFVDADDLWSPDHLACAAGILAAEPVDAVLSHIAAFLCPSLSAAQAARIRVPAAQPGWSRSALAIRRTAFERVGPLDPAIGMGEMVEWFDRARCLGLAFRVLPEVRVWRRLHAGSLANVAGGRHGEYIPAIRAALARRRAVS